jgi:group I intron endonuclease
MFKQKFYVYNIYFPTVDKFYVGWSGRLYERLRDHLGEKNLLGRALRKYNNWKINILHIVSSSKEAKFLEIEEIRKFNSINPNGYNLTSGGDGLENPSEDTKRKLKENHRGMLGKNHSKQTRLQMSVSHSGKNNSMYGKQHSQKTKLKMKYSQLKRRLEEYEKLEKIKCPFCGFEMCDNFATCPKCNALLD